MAEDSTNPLLASMLGALQQKGGAKGVVKDSDGKVSPSLTPSEAARYEKIFGIMKKVVNPGPEAGQLDKTSNGKAGSTAAMEKIVKKKGGGFELPGLGALAALGGAAALIGAALTTMSDGLLAKIEGFTEDIVKFGDDAGDEFGKLGGLAVKLGSKIGLKSLKMIPFLGSFVNFYYAKKHFDNEEWFDGVWELASGIAGFFPGGQVLSMVMDGYKIYAEVEANRTEKETGKKPAFSDILKKHASAIGGWILDKIKEGKVPLLSAFWKIGEGLGEIFSGNVKSGFQTLLMAYPALFGQGYANSPMIRGLNYIGALVEENAPAAMKKAGEMAGDAWGWMKEVFIDIGEVFSSFFEGIQKWVSDTLDEGTKFITSKLGINTGEITNDDGSVNKTGIAKEVGKAAYNLSPLGMGINAGKAVADYFMNDGTITKDGKVTAFNDQDDVLAAKSGGPIDKMLDGNSVVMKSLASINAQQLNVLVEIREGIKSLGKSGGLSFSNTSLTQEFFE